MAHNIRRMGWVVKSYTYCLAGGFNPSEKWWSSSVEMIIPNIWKNKINVPNHQPVSMENHHGNHRSSTSIFLGNNVQDAMLNSQRVHLHLCIWLKRNNSPSWKVKRHVGIVAPILNEVVNFLSIYLNVEYLIPISSLYLCICMMCIYIHIYIYVHPETYILWNLHSVNN